jgi:hypothetical protein
MNRITVWRYDVSKLENTLLKYANAILDAKNGKTNPTLGELVDEHRQEVKDLMLGLYEQVNKRANDGNWTHDVRDSYFHQKVSEL